MRKHNHEQARHRYFLRFLLTCFLSNMILAAGSDPTRPPVPIKTRASSHPYCGVYCIYTAMKLAGQETDIQKLLKPEYIGSSKGSTLQELKKAVEDNGLYAVAVEELTSQELRNCPHPVVLHVKLNAASKSYDHYELFLRTENDKARMFNPPDSPELIPFHQLAPRWDGIGLIISARPIDLGTIMAPAKTKAIIYGGVALAAILIGRWLRRWTPKRLQDSRCKLLVLSMIQSAGFVTAALVCGIGYHQVNREGFLAHSGATRWVQQAHAGNLIPKVSERKVRKLLGSGTVFIDARFTHDYEAGHLERAISVPVDANDVERGEATAHISKDARIVLYCQSATCKFAESVAIKLKADGFPNVSIFRGGWAEWVATNGKPKKATL